MSEPIPESVPTSFTRGPPPKKRPRHLPPSASASATQAASIENLMDDPSAPVALPASSTDHKSTLPPPPEIVANVQGSSAGAGSGEFHVYKASRRREYERLRAMEEEAENEEGEKRWEEEERRRKELDDERTRRNREKRNRRKGGKSGKGKEGSADVEGEEVDGVAGGEGRKEKRGIKVRELRRSADEDGDEDGDGDGDGDGDVETGRNGRLTGAAEVMKENGITIHDDD